MVVGLQAEAVVILIIPETKNIKLSLVQCNSSLTSSLIYPHSNNSTVNSSNKELILEVPLLIP